MRFKKSKHRNTEDYGVEIQEPIIAQGRTVEWIGLRPKRTNYSTGIEGSQIQENDP